MYHHLPIIQKKTISNEVIDGVNYIKLRTIIYKSNDFKRIASMLSYAWHFFVNIKKIIQITGKPDCIIVSSTHPFHYYPLIRFAKKNNIPLIFEVRDLWPSSLIELLKLKTYHPLIMLLSYIEKHAYKNSTKVVSLLENAQPYMISKGLESSKFNYIPNGTEICIENTSKAPLHQKILELIQQLKKQNKFLIGYAGSMGPPNALEHLLAALLILKNLEPNIHCILLGQGQNKEHLKNFSKVNQLQNVTFIDSIPKTMIQQFLREMDILYIGWQNVRLYQYGVSPNKIFDYMLASKPIIESGGAPISIVEKAKCGFKCLGAKPDDIAQAILKMYQLTESKRHEMGAMGHQYLLQNHNYKKLANDYLKLIKEISS